MTDFTPQAPFFLGLDLGGTNIKAGVVDDAGRSLSRVTRPTEADAGPETGVDNLVTAGRAAVAESGIEFDAIERVGLASPGTMDIPAGMLLDPPNLRGWNDFPLRDRVADRLDKPTTLQNDANSAAFGEYWVGAGRNAHSLVFWTLGTGIGCGIVIGGMIVQGEHSHGSECGHIIIEMDNGRLCDSGQYGTLEAYASAKSLVRRCHEALDAGRDSALLSRRESGEELTPLVIGQAAEAGDDLADELVMDAARYLGVGSTTLMHTIDPDVVLFGGAMTFGREETELGRRFLERIRQEVRTRAFPVPAEKTRLEFASLGNDAGYIGAAGCARRDFLAK